MKMDRFFTGLVALVAGLALSAGSAYATKGYTMGDAAPSKLVPHYEIGDTKSTIIGVQNMNSGDNETQECADTADPPVALTGDAVPNVCKADYDEDATTAPTGPRTGEADDLAAGNAQANMDDAQNLIVTATAFGPSGMMQATKDICLAPGAFGYFVLGKMDMDMDMGPHAAMFTTADGTFGTDGTMTTTNDDGTTTTGPKHVYNGYVTLVASDRVQHCDGRRTPNDEPVKIVVPNSEAPNARIDNPAIAAWTIVHDPGMGSFGVEVPTVTVTMSRGENNTIVGDGMLDCYDMAAADGVLAADTTFDDMKCGLIPERHNNDRIVADRTPGEVGDTPIAYMAGDPDTRGGPPDDGTDPPDDGTVGNATPLAKVQVRYDVNMAAADTKVFVWLGTAEAGRELDITVRCEEGMAPADIDNPAADTADMLSMATIAAPDRHLVLDPSMGVLGGFTDECMGSRGVLELEMPDGSHAGMVWSHISLDGATYRMNFPGYSMANPMACSQMFALSDDNDDERNRLDACM